VIEPFNNSFVRLQSTLKLRLSFRECLVLLEASSYATFSVATFASIVGITTVLLLDQGKGLQAVSLWARKLNNAVRGNSYAACDLEALAVYEAVKYWLCNLEACP
jgi:hypothetical protein